jgi:hypothetical protein
MPKPKLPFLHRYATCHGKVKFYVKLHRQNGRGTLVKGLYRSDEFMQNYHALACGTPVTPAPVVAKDGKGTLGWLIKLYRESRDWTHNLSQGTRKQRGPILRRMEETAGDLPLARRSRRACRREPTIRPDTSSTPQAGCFGGR